MIVVDTNIISYLLLPTSFTDSVESLYKSDPAWLAPRLWKSEFRNVLALYLRKNIITLEKALSLQEVAESIMAKNEYDVSSSQILALVNESNCSAYDCEFVALAHHFNVRLVTQDKKILSQFPESTFTLENYFSNET